ncbi:Succinate--CoA ligase [ADP-forming] subunit alpha [Colletotrichum orbiculare MAFF 240422]|uniref:Succinate--CoA ligase [ADP-forming] subunit alpha n=1 Tax=Colletotrichum orbiculare (strain 104-T / ATCC 96160 / CBS 514.97 / LARS 414 / MAFF 240422) TaxID=1213857 RepID=A0A484G9Y9_COLOR|nr:Succinate--CoA ligase [ADP-forming] subunit alpha [Colletotrichum orbiculare MAFF 240422]
MSTNTTMRAVAVDQYGGIGKLQTVQVPRPSDPSGHDIVVHVKACSVNPVDTKVRAGVYDDYPDYYERTPSLPQILGFDGAGVVESVGPEVDRVKVGDDVFYSGSPIRQGSNAWYQVVDSRSVALKPKNLDWGQAASMPLTWITAWEALVERMEIREGEDAGILIVNGAGGVGSVASQIARRVLKLPVVVTTASRDETVEFSKTVGAATHTVNHHEDIVAQVEALKLHVPIKYVFITHTPTSGYLGPAAKILAPFGKVCSIVQDKEMPMYGTEFMSKSLTFVWALLGTKPYYGVQLDSHGKILDRLRGLLEGEDVKCHCTQKLRMNEEDVKQAHELVESGKVIGKIALEVFSGKDTIQHLYIDGSTKVIYQGFTGRAATINAKDTIAYGTKVVGGVSPGKGGQEHLGLPVFNTVKEAMQEVKPHASAVFVPAQFAAAAITEAIEAEVPLVVSVAEHVPVHDMARVHEILQTQSKTRLVGPNCPGIIAPEQCRIGIMPYKQYTRGVVGIVSKSGTLSYEAVGATTKAGLGQSIVVGMGGDMMPGTTLLDGLRLFFDHDETKGIIVIGEIGGEAELRAAEAIREYNSKPALDIEHEFSSRFHLGRLST